MDRRQAIKTTSLLMGGALFGPNILGVLKGCTHRPGTTWEPALLTDTQARLTTALADTILPPDDYPVAADLGVPAFIDQCVNETYTRQEQQYFLDGLDAFNELARGTYNADFADLDPEQQHEFALQQNNIAIESPENIPEDAPVNEPFFLLFKELTLLGYFTTETGALEVLQYQMNFDEYIGCAPLDEVGGKTWAT